MGTETTLSIPVADDDFVYVCVPRRLYDLVIQTINHNAPGSAQTGQVLAVSDLAREEAYRGWKRGDVTRLKRETEFAAINALFEFADKLGDAPVAIAELERATGKTQGEVRGDLIRLTTFARNELGLADTWPFRAETGPDGRATYRVPEVVRNWWREA